MMQHDAIDNAMYEALRPAARVRASRIDDFSQRKGSRSTASIHPWSVQTEVI